MPNERGSHVTELLPGYALGALTDDEMNRVAEHLAACHACQVEFQQLQAVADELPLALAQSVPPSRVKTRLLQAIHSSRRGAEPSRRLPFWRKLPGIIRIALPAAGVMLVAVIAVVNVLLWRQLSLTNQAASPHLRVVSITGTENSPGASGALIMDADGMYGTLVVDNLAALDPAHQYQVWLIREGNRVSGGVFSVNPVGYASLEVQAPMPLTHYDAIGITIEPYGGSPGPTGVKVLGGDIHQ